MTGQTVITNALTALGINQMGGTPSTSDLNTGLAELNDMWQAWAVDEGLIYSRITERYPVVSGKQYYTIGPTNQADFSQAEYPTHIYSAHLVFSTGGAISGQNSYNSGFGYSVGDTGSVIQGSGQLATYIVTSVAGDGYVTGFNFTSSGDGFLPGNSYQTQTGGSQPGNGYGFTINITSVTDPTQNRFPLDIVTSERYWSHRDLSATASVPDEIFPDYALDSDGFMRLYFFPLFTQANAVIELDIAVNFGVWALTVNYMIPASYADALKWALAFRLLSYFGEAVSQPVAQIVTANGEKSELRIREMNKRNRQLPDGMEMLTPPPPGKAA